MIRDEFREAVFKRDNHRCVVCKSVAVDAHHILERKLFEDGGYYLDNGASLCGDCHYKAETTELSCERIREAAGITNVVLPSDFEPSYRYDKWGNIFFDDTLYRLKGELGDDEGFLKLMKRSGLFRYLV